jgi:hypothetical protein
MSSILVGVFEKYGVPQTVPVISQRDGSSRSRSGSHRNDCRKPYRLWRLQRADAGSLRALLALRDFELHALVLGERFKAAALDFLEMGKQVLAAVVGRDEAKALVLVKPFHGAGLGSHIVNPCRNILRITPRHGRSTAPNTGPVNISDPCAC